MILTRSPHYLTIPKESPESDEVCTEYYINIYVWSGFKTSVPATPTYVITRENYDGTTDSEDIDISRIVDGELDRTLTILNGSITYQNDDCQQWVKTEVYYTIASGFEDIAQFETTDLATRGYGYGMEGKNQTSINPLLAGNIFRVSSNSVFIIPIDATLVDEYEGVTATSLPDSEWSLSEVLSESTDTSTALPYVVVDLSNITSDTRLPIYLESTLIATLLIDYDTRYTNTDVVFFNQYGAQQVLSMRKEKVESMTVESESYESSGLQPSDGFHQFVNYNVNAKTNVKMSSGYIPQSSNEAFKQLMLSDRIWLLTDGVYTPANIITNNITYKTRANDKVVNYDITFGHSFYEVNNV